jgi:hypothetical protein
VPLARGEDSGAEAITPTFPRQPAPRTQPPPSTLTPPRTLTPQVAVPRTMSPPQPAVPRTLTPQQQPAPHVPTPLPGHLSGPPHIATPPSGQLPPGHMPTPMPLAKNPPPPLGPNPPPLAPGVLPYMPGIPSPSTHGGQQPGYPPATFDSFSTPFPVPPQPYSTKSFDMAKLAARDAMIRRVIWIVAFVLAAGVGILLATQL